MEKFIQMWPVTLHGSELVSNAKPLVILSLMVEGRPLGKVSIRLTCDQRSCKQMLLAIRNSTINDEVGFHQARSVGWEGERTCCSWYPPCDDPSYPELATYCNSYVEGVVSGYVDDGMFWICTRSYSGFTIRAPEIGYVESGLNLLRKVLRRYTTHILHGKYDASKIKISDINISE